jgi:tetratricopeptide (TPR) repeat protein
MRLGEVLGRPGAFNLGDTPGALAAFAKAEAMALRSVEAAAGAPAVEDRRRLAAVHGRISEVYLAERRPEAVTRAAAAVAALAGVTPAEDDVETLLAMAAARFMLASTRQTLTAESPVDDWNAALAIYDRLLAANPTHEEYRRNAALVHKNLGAYWLKRGDRANAIAAIDRALAIDRARVEAAPANAMAQLDYSFGLTQSAEVLTDTGDRAGAAARYEEAVAIRARLAAADPLDVRALGRLVYAQVRLARLRAWLGRPHDARALYRDAIAGADRVLAAAPAQVATGADRVAALAGLGAISGNCEYIRQAEAGLRAMSSRAPAWVSDWTRDASRDGPCEPIRR